MIVEFAGVPGCGKTTVVAALSEQLRSRGVDVVAMYVGRFDRREAIKTVAYLAAHPAYWRGALSVRSRRACVMYGSFLRRERRRRAAEGLGRVLMDEGPVNGAAMMAAQGGPIVHPSREADIAVLIEMDPGVAATRTQLRQERDPRTIVSSPEYLRRFSVELERVIEDLSCVVVREVNDPGLVERLVARIAGLSTP